jgi:Flp pilus assembly protein TadG
MTYFVLLMPVMVAVAGLSVDTATWYVHKRGLQSAADAAAISGAYEKVRQGTAFIEDAAKREAAENGATDTSLGGDETVVINHPPLTGERAGAGDSVEATITRQVNTLFSSIVFQGPITMSVRAVAIADVSDTCIWALDPSGSGITASGGADTTFNCGLQSNSDISTNGGACVTTTKIKTSGDIDGDCITAGSELTNVPPATDPFAGLNEPDLTSCTRNGPLSIKSKTDADGNEIQQDVYPGVYCGAVTVTGWAHFNDDPGDVYDGPYAGSDGQTYGLYVLHGAGLTINVGSAIATGTNITFFLSDASGVADNVTITNGTVDLSASTDGPYVGIIFWQSPNTTGNISHNFTGGGTMHLTGILYFPNQDVHFAGGSAFDATESLLIAKTVDFVGASYLGGFEGTPIKANPLLVKATIVE